MVNNKTKRIIFDAMLAAMVAILGALAITTNAFKITFETLPILFAGFVFGPIDGMIVGFVGTLVYQMLVFGFSATTLLWILPYVIMGLLCGLVAKQAKYDLSVKRIAVTTIALEFLVTILNTGVIYVNSHIYGYYYPALILGSLALRLAICFGKGAVFGFILPVLVNRVKKALA